MTGMVGNKWSLNDFGPMDAIPTAVNLTTYGGGNENFMAAPFTELLSHISSGEMRVQVRNTFTRRSTSHDGGEQGEG